MRIEPITNTNFRGLFTDKTAQNGGNWRMEYRPYSWENQNTSTMANKEKINIFSTNLPDNEEIYTAGTRESSSDILGTESYYNDKSTSKMRSTIEVMPAMNREESLRVKSRKLDKFIELKQNMKSVLSRNITSIYMQVQNNSRNYDAYSTDYDKGFWASVRTSSENKKAMDAEKSNIMASMQSLNQTARQYIELDNSINAVKIAKQQYEAEIEQLEKARKADMLIDISRRNIAEPNQALLIALRMVRASANKLVALPNKIIPLNSLLDMLRVRNVNFTVRSEVEKYIELLIKSKA